MKCLQCVPQRPELQQLKACDCQACTCAVGSSPVQGVHHRSDGPVIGLDLSCVLATTAQVVLEDLAEQVFTSGLAIACGPQAISTHSQHCMQSRALQMAHPAPAAAEPLGGEPSAQLSASRAVCWPVCSMCVLRLSTHSTNQTQQASTSDPRSFLLHIASDVLAPGCSGKVLFCRPLASGEGFVEAMPTAGPAVLHDWPSSWASDACLRLSGLVRAFLDSRDLCG